MKKKKAVPKTASEEPFGWTEGAETVEIERAEPPVRVLSGLVYSQITGRGVQRLEMTVLIPAVPGAKPAVLFFPGGGWLQAVKERFPENRMALAKAGFVVAAANYRTVPDAFPAAVIDGKTAVRFLRAHAKTLEIDPDRIGVMGNSAGGWLAEMLALSEKKSIWDQGDWKEYSSRVSACCVLHPVSNLEGIAEGLSEEHQEAHASAASPEALMLSGPAFRGTAPEPVSSRKKEAAKASPMGLLSLWRKKDAPPPPFLIVHGSADSMVSPVQSAKMFRLLEKKKANARYVLIRNADHSSDPVWYQEPVCQMAADFFRQTLGGKAKKKK